MRPPVPSLGPTSPTSAAKSLSPQERRNPEPGACSPGHQRRGHPLSRPVLGCPWRHQAAASGVLSRQPTPQSSGGHDPHSSKTCPRRPPSAWCLPSRQRQCPHLRVGGPAVQPAGDCGAAPALRTRSEPGLAQGNLFPGPAGHSDGTSRSDLSCALLPAAWASSGERRFLSLPRGHAVHLHPTPRTPDFRGTHPWQVLHTLVTTQGGRHSNGSLQSLSCVTRGKRLGLSGP